VEAPLYRGRDLFVAGGANSAGQAALHLARFARRVTLLVRGESLSEMSQYLIDELAAVPNISVRYRTEVAGAEGATLLEGLVLRDRETGAEERVTADGLAVLIGQKPSTDWADGLLRRDAQGFLRTGADLLYEAGRRIRRRRWWPLGRDPLFLETSVPGVFVAGDVRHGSTKRVASAVGEGAIAVQLVHQYLGDLAAADARALHGAGLPGARPAHTPLLDWSAHATGAWA
jgi:thioredoxin reductase (NADPH)